MDGELVILANARASEGKAAELEQALRDAATPTREMPGCLGFDLLRSESVPGVITAIERWASSEDHDRHLQAASQSDLREGRRFLARRAHLQAVRRALSRAAE